MDHLGLAFFVPVFANNNFLCNKLSLDMTPFLPFNYETLGLECKLNVMGNCSLAK